MHTGVKSFGCENRTAQESPIQSWKWILPSVVSASKSGAVSPICRAILVPPVSLCRSLSLLRPVGPVQLSSAPGQSGAATIALVASATGGVFVVQEHAATAHHFDLRLEVEGVMRSWAVPKGPSMDPRVKRLAVEVADHDKGHNSFEGALGGGGVIVWDHGTYEQGGRVAWPEALAQGHAVFVLHGHKLQGGFALQRTSAGPRPQWLLIKRRDQEARPGSDVVAERPESVLSGRTLAALLG